MSEYEGKYKNTEITRENLFQLQVCSDLTWWGVLQWLRKTHPAGTSNNWQMDTKPEMAPVTCSKHSDRKHFMFVWLKGESYEKLGNMV